MREDILRRLSVLAATVCCVALPPSAWGADRFWNNTGGGNFLLSSNWLSSLPPGPNDRAVFDLTGLSYLVTFSGSVATDKLLVNDLVSFDLGGTRTYSINSTDTEFSIEIGSSTTGANRLIVQNGTLTTVGGLSLATTAGASGSLVVSSGGVVSVNQTFITNVGQNGNGTLIISSGGSMSSRSTVLGNFTNGVGTMLVSGVGSSYDSASFTIGNQGSGVLTVTSAGQLTYSSQFRVAGTGFSGSSGGGAVTIQSGGVVSGSGTFIVGNTSSFAGSGVVTVGSAGSLTTGTANLAAGAASTALITLDGGSWSSGRISAGDQGAATILVGGGGAASSITTSGAGSNQLGASAGGTATMRLLQQGSFSTALASSFGVDGNATLDVHNNGRFLSTATLTLGAGEMGSGTASVSGAGSISCGTLIVGDRGQGSLLVLNGGSVSSTLGNIGANLNGSGTVLVGGAGAGWTSAGVIVVGGTTFTNGGSGFLQVDPGGSVATGSNSEMRIQARGAVVLNGGTLSVGTLTGTTSGFTFNSGTLNITGLSGLSITSGGPLGSSVVVDPAHRINVTGTLFNAGLVRGDGTISAGSFSNLSSGEVRVSGPEELTIAANNFTNAGQINLFGGLLETDSPITNSASGRINGRGTLRSGTLTNNGTIALSAGVGDIFSPLVQNATGKTIVTGNATDVFYSDVTNNAGSEFRVSTGSTAVFLGSVTGLGAFTGSGTAVFEGPASAGPIANSGTAVVEASGTLLASHVRNSGLIVNGQASIESNSTANDSAGTSVVRSLTIDTGAQLDLTNNSLIIDYDGSVGTLVDDTRLLLKNNQLTSSSADANHRIGYLDNATRGLASFSGQSVDPTSILIKFTFGGDSNLDGQVDVTDLGALATNWQTSNVWSGGDFNYDGFVDVTDLGILATDWQLGVGSPLGPGSFAAALSAVGLGGVAVPEPSASIGLLVLIGLLIARPASAAPRRIASAPAPGWFRRLRIR